MLRDQVKIWNEGRGEAEKKKYENWGEAKRESIMICPESAETSIYRREKKHSKNL